MKLPLKTRLLAAVFATTGQLILSAQSEPAKLTVQMTQAGPRISPMLYGIFFEEINCSGDGGIYAELARNRSFEDTSKPEHWSLVTSGSAKGEILVEAREGAGQGNKRCLRLNISEAGEGRVGVANEGYWGIPLKQGESYQFSISARCNPDFAGPLKVSLESKDGKIYEQKNVPRLSPDWQTFNLSLRSPHSDPDARLVVSASKRGTIWLDMISLFPKKTWKGRANGLRPDLAEMLQNLKPAFVRFPGGCWVEGDTLNFAYHWKETIGEPATRRNQYNIWQYYSTHGLGFHEYLQLCEDLHAEPLFVINCGMSHKENVPMKDLGPWVQDALDAIEYANGPISSHWGGLRARNGHRTPFNLKYMEIGNENGGPAYRERYATFYKAIKAQYPAMNLLADERPADCPLEIVDEHYYSNPAFFIHNADRYDTYDRNGPKIYVGEYAVTEGSGAGNLRGALDEAAFMVGMERNSDVVLMASYAPLFANVNYKKWNPDLINFNGTVAYGIPSYYVQKLFSENRGDQVLPVKLDVTMPPVEPNHGAIGLGTWETQSEYKEVRVTQDDKVLFESNPTDGIKGWKILGGDWQAKEGAIQQQGEGSNRRAIVGDPNWRDYTIHLKARKLGGAEGFLILFHVQDEGNWLWWNVGGWGNTRHAIEQGVDGGKGIVGREVPGSIETGRWYDVRIELKGDSVRCYLDGKLIHDAKETRQTQPLHVVAGRIDRSHEVVIKAVNASKTPYDTNLILQGAKRVRSKALVTTLTSSDPLAENSIENPQRVVPTTQTLDNASADFHCTFPANSLTVLRLTAQ